MKNSTKAILTITIIASTFWVSGAQACRLLLPAKECNKICANTHGAQHFKCELGSPLH